MATAPFVTLVEIESQEALKKYGQEAQERAKSNPIPLSKLNPFKDQNTVIEKISQNKNNHLIDYFGMAINVVMTYEEVNGKGHWHLSISPHGFSGSKMSDEMCMQIRQAFLPSEGREQKSPFPMSPVRHFLLDEE